MKKLTLKNPFEINGSTIKELNFEESIKGKHLKGVNLENIASGDSMLALISNITGMAPVVIDEMDFEDISEAANIVSELIVGKSST